MIKPNYKINSFVYFKLENDERILGKISQIVIKNNEYFYTIFWVPNKSNKLVIFKMIKSTQIEKEIENILEVWDLIRVKLKQQELELIAPVLKRVLRYDKIVYQLDLDIELGHDTFLDSCEKLTNKEKQDFIKMEPVEEFVTKEQFDKVFYSLI